MCSYSAARRSLSRPVDNLVFPLPCASDDTAADFACLFEPRVSLLSLCFSGPPFPSFFAILRLSTEALSRPFPFHRRFTVPSRSRSAWRRNVIPCGPMFVIHGCKRWPGAQWALDQHHQHWRDTTLRWHQMTGQVASCRRADRRRYAFDRDSIRKVLPARLC